MQKPKDYRTVEAETAAVATIAKTLKPMLNEQRQVILKAVFALLRMETDKRK